MARATEQGKGEKRRELLPKQEGKKQMAEDLSLISSRLARVLLHGASSM